MKASRLWAKRYDPGSLEAFTHVNESISRSPDATQNDLILEARAFLLLGEYFSRSPYEHQNNWHSATLWAEKALAFNSRFRELRMNKTTPLERTLDVLQANDAGALYWLAASLYAQVANSDSDSELETKALIKKMMDRVATLNPKYFYGAVYRFYGVYYALLPGAVGENLMKSRENFEVAIKYFPEFFENHVSYAQYYAAKAKDSALFKRELQLTIQTHAYLKREIFPEQLLEQNQAKILLSKGVSTP